MRQFHVMRNRSFTPIINVCKLWTLVSDEVKNAAKDSAAPVIDVTRAVSRVQANRA
jgi:large subunit ribosomal protein L27Ae